MFHAPIQQAPRNVSDMSSLLDCLARASSRPRYAFMVLNLIAEVARPDGSAGPFIKRQGASISLRNWLSDALTPMGGRDPKQLAMPHGSNPNSSRSASCPPRNAQAAQ